MKKGQMSVVIIGGIIVVTVTLLLFIIQPEPTTIIKSPYENLPTEQFLHSCLEESTDKAVNHWLEFGGDISTPHTMSVFPRAPLLYDNSTHTIVTKESASSDIGIQVARNMARCLYPRFIVRKQHITVGMNSNDVAVVARYTVEKDGKRIPIAGSITHTSEISTLIDYENSILSTQQNDVCLSCIDRIVRDSETTVRFELADEYIIYTVKKNEEQLVFAVRIV